MAGKVAPARESRPSREGLQSRAKRADASERRATGLGPRSSGGLGSGIDGFAVGVDERCSDSSRFIVMRTDFADGRHFRSCAGDETFVEVAELRRHDSPLNHFKAAPTREIDDRRSRYAGEEAISNRRMNRSALDEKNVSACGFGDSALPVQHQRVGIPAALRAMLGDGADHVEAGRFRERWGGRWIRSPIFRNIEPNALHALRGIEITWPIPRRDAQVDRVMLRGHAHHFRSAPSDSPHISVDKTVSLQDFGLGGVNLRDGPRHFKIENSGGIP